MMNTQRLEKVLKKMETEGLDQMIISDPYAIYYLTGRFIDPVNVCWHFTLTSPARIRFLSITSLPFRKIWA